jgi:hypothetical protein
MVNTKENRSLCFSNKLRQTFSYKEKVNASFIICNLYSSTFEGVLDSTAMTNKRTNHCKEYWYIGSINAKSIMQKNSKEARYATGRYP